MKKIILIILLALALSASTRQDSTELLICPICIMVDEVTQHCYCTELDRPSCGNDCDLEPFSWSVWKGVTTYFYRCHGWKMYAPLIDVKPSQYLIGKQKIER